MMLKLDRGTDGQPSPSRQYQVRMPYVPPEGIGLGDVIARMTQAIGVKPCTPCKQRQEALNQRVRLTEW